MTDYSDFNIIDDETGIIILDLFFLLKETIEENNTFQLIHLPEREFNIVLHNREKLKDLFEKHLMRCFSVNAYGITALDSITFNFESGRLIIYSIKFDSEYNMLMKWNYKVHREQAKRAVLDEKLHRDVVSLLKDMEEV